jgi:hypothetical protein
MDLHERLVAARKQAGYETAVEAAEAVGVPYGTYSGHENGSSGFRADKGEIYARRFKVRFEWLMREIGPMVDPATKDPEAQLRSALLAFGVDSRELPRLMAVIKTYVPEDAVTQGQSLRDDQSQPASPHRVEEPSR